MLYVVRAPSPQVQEFSSDGESLNVACDPYTVTTDEALALDLDRYVAEQSIPL
jgi:hypothetical protein